MTYKNTDHLCTVVVDDIINSGASVNKVLLSLAEEGVYSNQVFSIIDFRTNKKRELFEKKGVHHEFLFPLSQIVQDADKESESIDLNKYRTLFCFRPQTPSNTRQIFCRSNPLVDDRHVYFGTDYAVFYALDKNTGECVWKREGLANYYLKGIWSSPCFVEEGVCYGGYDGNLYLLNRNTGEEIWIFSRADFIGSSPFYAEDLKLVFVGLEYAMQGKGGSIVAIDSYNGTLKWEYPTHLQVHSSPCYSRKNGMIFCGSNDRDLMALDAVTGSLLWRIETQGICKMKTVLSVDEKVLYAVFTDSSIRAIDVFTGTEIWRYCTKVGNLASPLLVGRVLVAGSLDNCIYLLDSENGALLKRIQTDGRIMSEPSYFNGNVFMGNNSGAIIEFGGDFGVDHGSEKDAHKDKMKGGFEILGRYQLPDRVASKIAYCPDQDIFYAHTCDDRLFGFVRIK